MSPPPWEQAIEQDVSWLEAFLGDPGQPGVVVLAALVALLLLYVLLGVTFNCCAGATPVFPHGRFWSGLPNLLQDGFSYGWRRFMIACCGLGEYEDIGSSWHPDRRARANVAGINGGYDRDVRVSSARGSPVEERAKQPGRGAEGRAGRSRSSDGKSRRKKRGSPRKQQQHGADAEASSAAQQGAAAEKVREFVAADEKERRSSSPRSQLANQVHREPRQRRPSEGETTLESSQPKLLEIRRNESAAERKLREQVSGKIEGWMESSADPLDGDDLESVMSMDFDNVPARERRRQDRIQATIPLGHTVTDSYNPPSDMYGVATEGNDQTVGFASERPVSLDDNRRRRGQGHRESARGPAVRGGGGSGRKPKSLGKPKPLTY